mgnify:CR=1 FL=1
MNERTYILSQLSDMLQQANARELDLVWRILSGMLGGKEAAE